MVHWLLHFETLLRSLGRHLDVPVDAPPTVPPSSLLLADASRSWLEADDGEGTPHVVHTVRLPALHRAPGLARDAETEVADAICSEVRAGRRIRIGCTGPTATSTLPSS